MQPNPFGQPQPQQAPPNPFGQPQPGYAPAQPAYAPQAPVAPQYAQPQQYAAPAPVSNGLVATPGQFVPLGAPPADAVTGQPSIKSLANGRLLLIMPTAIERSLPGRPRQGDPTGTAPRPYDRLTATIVVLDGGTLHWGGEFQGDERKSADVPYVIKNKFITQTKLIVQLEEALQVRLQGGPGLTIGRLWKTGPEANAPYVLQDPNAADTEIYNRYVSQVNPFTL